MHDKFNIMLSKQPKHWINEGTTDILSSFQGHKHVGGGGDDIMLDIPRVGSYSQMNRLVRNLTTIAVEEKEQYVNCELLLEFYQSVGGEIYTTPYPFDISFTCDYCNALPIHIYGGLRLGWCFNMLVIHRSTA